MRGATMMATASPPDGPRRPAIAARLAPLALAALLLATALAAPRTLPARDDAGWVGKRVILQFNSVLRVGKVVVDNQKLENRLRGGQRESNRIYRVEKVNGPWLWLQAEKEGAAGWVRAAEVIPYDQAIDYFTNQIRANPANDAAYIGRGHIWRDKKEYDIAISDYTEAIRLDPGSEVAWYDRGLAWNDQKAHDKAIADYTEAIRLDPKFAIAFANRGKTWIIRKEYNKALADYTEAIRLDPKDAGAFSGRGKLWRRLGDGDKALADYTEAIRLDPKNAHGYVGRALAWFDKAQNEKALADYNEALRLDKSFAFAFLGRAVLDLTTRRDGAVAGMQALLELEKGKEGHATYAVILGHLAARISKDEDAAKQFLGQLAANLDTSAWPYPAVRFLRGDLDEAQLLALAVDTDKQTEARCFLGLHHDLEGRKDDALAQYRWVKEHGTKSFIEYGITLAELARLEAPAGDEVPAPVAKPAADPKPEPAEAGAAKFLGTVLYVPTPLMEARFGADPQPMADYVNALKARAGAILDAAEPGTAKGLLVAVGLKAGRRSKVWCQAVEGSIPPALLKTLERELAEVEPIALKAGSAGFGLQFGLGGKAPAEFPKVPERWNDAAQSSRSKKVIPPDDLFKILWPD